jgi:hypothetical protein
MATQRWAPDAHRPIWRPQVIAELDAAALRESHERA